MTATYHVSDGVARKVVNTLVLEGLVVARPGAGTFVRARPLVRKLIRTWARDLVGGSPFRSEMAAQGREGTWTYKTSTVQAPPQIRERLDLGAPIGDDPDTVQTSYLFRGDGEPVQLATSWEPLAVTQGMPIVAPEDGPHAGLGVVERMRLIGVLISHYVEEIHPRPATSEEAAALDIPNGSIVQVIERTHWADDRAVETADIIVPGEKYRLVYATPVIQQ